MRKTLIRALALSGLVVGALVAAAPGSAATPAGDICAADAKINGRGATFATQAHRDAFIPAYRDLVADVCGPAAASLTGNGPVEYNWSPIEGTSESGSGAGRRSQICRTDAFGGSDSPYDLRGSTGLEQLMDVPGGNPVLTGVNSDCTFVNNTSPLGPFLPPTSPNAEPFPSVFDGPAPATRQTIMTIPIATGADAVGINLSPSVCGGDPIPSSINLSRSAVSKLFGGVITFWNDPAIVADNPGLANCAVTVKRVVRQDSSGTTQVWKNYLRAIDPNTVQCDGVETWNFLAQDAQNTNWPTGGACSPLIPANGNTNVISTCRETGVAVPVRGHICYGELAEFFSQNFPTGNRRLAKLRNPSNTSFVGPTTLNRITGAFTQANCQWINADTGAILLQAPKPGNGGPIASVAGVQDDNDALVGLNYNPDLGANGQGDTWATNNLLIPGTTTDYSDLGNDGSKYPACGMTWLLVYTGLNTATPGAQNDAIDRLTQNQRKTLFNYVIHGVLGEGQFRLGDFYYAPLPGTWLDAAKESFRRNF